MPKGFQNVSPEMRKEIARKGGKAAHAQGTAHEFTTEEARAAGRKGGLASHAKRRAALAIVASTESAAPTIPSAPPEGAIEDQTITSEDAAAGMVAGDSL